MIKTSFDLHLENADLLLDDFRELIVEEQVLKQKMKLIKKKMESSKKKFMEHLDEHDITEINLDEELKIVYIPEGVVKRTMTARDISKYLAEKRGFMTNPDEFIKEGKRSQYIKIVKIEE